MKAYSHLLSVWDISITNHKHVTNTTDISSRSTSLGETAQYRLKQVVKGVSIKRQANNDSLIILFSKRNRIYIVAIEDIATETPFHHY